MKRPTHVFVGTVDEYGATKEQWPMPIEEFAKLFRIVATRELRSGHVVTQYGIESSPNESEETP